MTACAISAQFIGMPPRAPKPPIYPNRLRELRDRAGMTLEDVGELVGLGHQAVSKLERGLLRLRVDQINRFSKALNCAPTDILPNEPTWSDRQREIAELLGRLSVDDQERLLKMAKALED